jgi:nitroreductase
MNILDCIKNRRSVRTFTNTPVPDDVLTKILDAGRWAPSGANSQPTEFVVVKNKDSIAKIRAHIKEVLQMAGVDDMSTLYNVMKKSGSFSAAGTQEVTWAEYLNPPVMVIVASDGDKNYVNQENEQYNTMSGDASALACQTMMLGAYALGIGSCWLASFDQERIKYWFGIPTTLHIGGIMCFGYAKYWPKAPEWALSTDAKLYPRRPLADMIDQEQVDDNKWLDYVLHDPFWLPRKEFLRTEKYVRPTKLTTTAAVEINKNLPSSEVSPTGTPSAQPTSSPTATPNPDSEMEVFDCIRKRRGVGILTYMSMEIRYTNTPIPDDVLTKIIDAGRWAYSELNSQPFQFIVVKDPLTLHDLKQLTMDSFYDPKFYKYKEGWPQTAIGIGGNISLYESYNAPVWVILWTDREKRKIYPYSCDQYRSIASDATWAAAGNIALAARAFGIANCYLTFPDARYAKHILGIPETGDVGTFMPLGYPTQMPDDPGAWKLRKDPRVYPRRPLENMVHNERFDEDKWQTYRPVVSYGGAPRREAALKKLVTT